MTLLNLDGPSGRNFGKPFKVILGIGALAAVVAVASTLAANININSGPVEFGQGVAQTTACDDSITVTPRSQFINSIDSETVGTQVVTVGAVEGNAFMIKVEVRNLFYVGMPIVFESGDVLTNDPTEVESIESETTTADIGYPYFEGITDYYVVTVADEIFDGPGQTTVRVGGSGFQFSGVDVNGIDATEGKCRGKIFTLKAYGETATAALASYSVFVGENGFTSSDGSIESSNPGTSSSGFSLEFISTRISASSVYKITIESSDQPSIAQFISVGSCDFDSIGGDTSTAITSIAAGLIDGIPGASIVGDAEAWGLPAPTFNTFLRDDGVSLGEGFALSAGWGEGENATLDTCLEDLLSESYPDVDPMYNVHAITFTVSVPSNVNGFNFDWVFASNEDAGDEFDTAALIVDGRDFALLSDGKVVHVYNNNLNNSSIDFETAPIDIAEDLSTPGTWSNKFYSRATFDKANNPPDGSGFSLHQITIAVGNTGDASAHSTIFVSNFRG